MDISVASDFIRGDFYIYLERGNGMNRLTFVQLCAESKIKYNIFRKLKKDKKETWFAELW